MIDVLLAAMIYVAPALAGTICVLAFTDIRDKLTAVLIGTTIGVATVTTAIFAASAAIPAAPGATLIAITSSLLAAWIVAQKTNAAKLWQQARLDKIGIAVLIAAAALFLLIAPKLLFEPEDGNLATGITNAYGDLGWHVATITILQHNDTLTPPNPIFAGHRLMYPFMTNYFSAILTNSGLSLASSVVVPTIIFLSILCALYYKLAHILVGHRGAAVLALILFLFGGATAGWLYALNDWQTSSQSLLTFFQSVSRPYAGHSNDTNQLVFANPVTNLLLPQRPHLIGMPLALTILILLIGARRPGSFIIAGAAAGLLPLFHAHAVLALIAPIILLLLINRNYSWLWFFGIAALVGLPEVAYYVTGIEQGQAFLRWSPGWMASGNGFVFWLKNTGLILPLALAAYALKPPGRAALLAAVALFIFVVANLFLLAPWDWSNIELFVYWYLFTLPLVSWVVVKSIASKNSVAIAIASIIVITHTLSGFIDIARLALLPTPVYGEWDQDARLIADQINQHTQTGDIILTAPVHNSPAALSARTQYLGYAAHVWTHGGLPWTRENAIGQYFTSMRDRLPDTQPDYVLIGPQERHRYPNLIIRPNWELTATTDQYQLYRVAR